MNHHVPQYEVLTMGETMLRFTPPAFERFGQSRAVEMHVGGSESNTAVGLARLGHRVCWLSRLTQNPLGRWIAEQITSHGVDTSQVIWTDQDRVGTYYMERGPSPRNSQVFYDRADSAMSQITIDELPNGLFQPNVAKIFHVSGITLGISALARQTTVKAIQLAKACGQKISFDLNYRSRLWTESEAYTGCEPVLAQSDYIFLPVRDAYSVCGIAEHRNTQEVCNELHTRWPAATIVVTMGSLGAAAIGESGAFFQRKAFETVEVERLGGGDAFSAGYLSAALRGGDVPEALAWACAAAALKYTIPGDLPLIDQDAVAALVQNESNSVSIRR